MRRRGNTALEFGMLMPALTLLIFMGVNWGFYLFEQITVLSAAQRGTRLAAGASSARHPALLAQQCARDWMTAYGLPGDDAVITITISPDGASKAIKVKIVLPFRTPIGIGVVPGQIEETVTGVYYGWMLDPV